MVYMNGIPWTVNFPENQNNYYWPEFGINGIVWNKE